MGVAGTHALLIHCLLIWGNCSTMKLPSDDEFRIALDLEQTRVLEGESLVLRLRYINDASSTQYITVPDPEIPTTFSLEVSVTASTHGIVAAIDGANLPMTEHGLHGEPEEVALEPRASFEVDVNLSPYLPPLGPGAYVVDVASAEGLSIEPASIPFEVVPLPPVRAASAVQDAARAGLVTAYLTSVDGRDVVLLERLRDFATEHAPAGAWPVDFRRRVLEEERGREPLREIHLSRKAGAMQPWRHLLVRGPGGAAVVALQDGRFVRRTAIEALEGAVVPGTLLTEPEGALHLFTRGADGALRAWRFEQDQLRAPVRLEGEAGGDVHLFSAADRRILFYLDDAGRTLSAVDRAVESDGGRRLWTYDVPVRQLEAVPVLDGDRVGGLIIGLTADGDVADLLLWDFEGAPESVAAERFADQLRGAPYLVASNGVHRIVTFGTRFTAQEWQVPPNESAFIAAGPVGPLRFRRAGGWWQRVP